jgi:hypothetical protein
VVSAEGCREVERLVRADPVVEGPEGLRLVAEFERIGDLEPI